MNLVRLGHYHVPTGRDDSGYCQTALVVGVVAGGQMTGTDIEAIVNLRVWDSDGDAMKRLDVGVRSPDPTKATFHLSGDCPWHR